MDLLQSGTWSNEFNPVVASASASINLDEEIYELCRLEGEASERLMMLVSLRLSLSDGVADIKLESR